MNTDEAFHMLRESGVTEAESIQIVRQWLREGKIKYEGGKGVKKAKYPISHTALELLDEYRMEQNKTEIIKQLKIEIKLKDDQIEGIEELHKNTTEILIQQREELNKEIAILKKENTYLHDDRNRLSKENVELRNKLNGKFSKEDSKPMFHHSLNDYKRKLGLSKMVSEKEIQAVYKQLLKLSHPDGGGDGKLFHYIKTDYDSFKKSVKD
ncbi:hypothetical protein ABET51_03930 [Metabacillus fastidiosus]|uniref:hypothetical protein n=1 Tax=Metabacillus fastidiosus TaxID=1458 RepID=UPI003D2CBD5B